MSRWFLSVVVAIILFGLLGKPAGQPAIGQEASTPQATPIQSLAQQAEFSSPTLDELQQRGMQLVSENIAFSAYGHTYRLISFDPIGVPSGDGNMPGLGSVMLFQLDNTVGNLVWREDIGPEWPILGAKNAETAAWPTPGDWEDNGQIEFGVLNVHDSTCGLAILNMYVLSSDGKVTAQFRNMIPLEQVVKAIEIQ